MDGTTRLQVLDLNKNLTCILCQGYLVDATTVIECLHSFCRTCIVTYLKTNKSCPTCDTVVHKTRPHQNIRSDKLLQDLVYKLVPGLYKDEMRRRREFYTAHYEDAPKRPGEERGDEMCDRFIFTPDEQISLAVHLCPHGGEDANSKLQVFKTREEYKSRLEKKTKESIDVRYLQCKAAVPVGLLKKFLRLKYDLPPHYQIEMFNNDDLLPDTSSLADVAYSCCWRRKSPLTLSFSIYEHSTRTIKWGEAIPKLTHSSCLKWHQVKPMTAPTTTSIPVSDPNESQIHPETQTASCTTPVPKPNEPCCFTDLDKQPKVSTEIKEELKSPPPNGLVAQKMKSNPSLSKVTPHAEKKPKSVNKVSSKKSLLGKRAAKSPIRIAPAPSKDAPILKMPKMIKLESNTQSGISSSVQVACPPPSFTPVSSPSATVPLFPLMSSSFLPAHMRSGQTTSFVKAFPAGLVAIPAVTSKPASLCSFAPNAVHASAPASLRRTTTNTSTNHSQPRSISKALSSLSLSSPPLPKTTPVTQGVFFSQPLSSTSSATLSFSVKSTSASAAMSTTVPTTSIASPTPAASASPTPAAVPSQQSQTQCSEASAVFNQHCPFSQTAVTCANQPAASTPVFTYVSSTLNHNEAQASTSTKHLQNAPKGICPNGYLRSNFKSLVSAGTPSMNSLPMTMSSQVPKTISSQVPKTTSSHTPKTVSSQIPKTLSSQVPKTMSSQAPKTMSSQVPKPAPPHPAKTHTPVPLEAAVTPKVTTTPSTTPNTNGHRPLQTPSSSGGGASSQKKLTKPKKIADIANKLHKRVSQTVDAQNTPKRSQSPSTRKQQQPMNFTALKPPTHQDSKLFNINGQNSPMTPLGVTLKQGQPLTSSLFDPKSMHTNLINGRLEEPLNLVTRDKDYRLAPSLTRSELPPVVK